MSTLITASVIATALLFSLPSSTTAETEARAPMLIASVSGAGGALS